MNESINLNPPQQIEAIVRETENLGFSMSSDARMGSFLKSLISSKPGGHFLELGTGTGLGTAWMLDGMTPDASLITIDNDSEVAAVASKFLGGDSRMEIIVEDGGAWLKAYEGEPFDLIFADAWPGKYFDLDETLALIKPGGFYVIDDMIPQPNWPDGHQEKAEQLVEYLDSRADFHFTKLHWSTGVIFGVKK